MKKGKILSKTFVIAVLIGTITAISSCTNKSGKEPQSQSGINSLTNQNYKSAIIGKWYRISRENGYSELEIDSLFVTAFSEKLGKSRLEYRIENDSFKYLTINYSAKIIPSGDSMIILSGKDNIANLFRYDESINAFESVPNENDTLKFKSYQEKFYKRAFQALIKAGIIRFEQ